MKVGAIVLTLAAASLAFAEPKFIQLPGKSPIVSIRLVFTTGAAFDPSGKAGAANLTAGLLGGGGTKSLTRKEILDAMYPMATSVSVQTDKEMTVFSGETHIDNLEKFYGIMRDMILNPGWRADDFTRVRDDTLNTLKVSLRGNNDEELGKEELYSLIYTGHPYSHEDLGTVAALTSMTLADLQAFYKRHYTQANLMVGLAGGYPANFPERIKRDFAALPAGSPDRLEAKNLAPPVHNQATIIEKDTRSVAWSLGFPMDVKRGDPDYPALLLAQSWLGQHRLGGRLFERMREQRGLNYGDYAYVEYFPFGMFTLEPPANIARHQQIFQIWVRPVEPPTATFTLRLAMFELNRVIEEGITEKDFQQTRSFLPKYINVLTKSKDAELGYAIDSAFYGIPNYNEYIRTSLGQLTLADVNRAIRKHWHADRIQIVSVAKDAAALKASLTSGEPSPIQYNAPKPKDILDEDRIVERWPLKLRPEDVQIVPVSQVFEN